MAETKKNDRELAYYLTVFKVEGHSTYRASLSSFKNGFKHSLIQNAGKNPPKITEERTYRFDRVTGSLVLIDMVK